MHDLYTWRICRQNVSILKGKNVKVLKQILK